MDNAKLMHVLDAAGRLAGHPVRPASKFDQLLTKADALRARADAAAAEAVCSFVVTIRASAAKADDAPFDESKHPRAKDGKFGSGGGSSGGSVKGAGSQADPSSGPMAPAKALKAKFSPSVGTKLKELGFTKKTTADGHSYFVHGTTDVKVYPNLGVQEKKNAVQTRAWISRKEGHDPIHGSGAEALEKLLTRAKAAAEAAKATPAQPSLSKHGYELQETKTSAQGTVALFSKGSAKIALETTSGVWFSQSPGFQAKLGIGEDKLEKLLSGDKEVLKDLGKPAFGQTVETWTDMMVGIKPTTAPAQPHESASGAGEDHSPAHIKQYKALRKGEPTATPEEETAVRSYTGSGYVEMNQKLRADPEGSKSNYINAITKFLDRASLPEAVTLYRGVKSEYAKILKSVIRPGTEFIDHGFVSMSTHKGAADQFAGGLKMEISVPKGAKATPISHFGTHANEHEVLAQRGSVLKVTHFDRANGLVKCELLPPENDHSAEPKF